MVNQIKKFFSGFDGLEKQTIEHYKENPNLTSQEVKQFALELLASSLSEEFISEDSSLDPDRIKTLVNEETFSSTEKGAANIANTVRTTFWQKIYATPVPSDLTTMSYGSASPLKPLEDELVTGFKTRVYNREATVKIDPKALLEAKNRGYTSSQIRDCLANPEWDKTRCIWKAKFTAGIAGSSYRLGTKQPKKENKTLSKSDPIVFTELYHHNDIDKMNKFQ